jgi:hypothetical protein
VRFTFAEKDGGTEATWTMDGSMPWFLFWMTSMKTALIGMDYERGLSMLKDVLETGSVPSKLEFLGKTSSPGFNYVGVRTSCARVDIGEAMAADFKNLGEHIEQKTFTPAGPPFSIYHKWDVAKGRADYTLGFPVEKLSAEVGNGLVSGGIPACDVYTIKHTGPYRHLGNAWSSGMIHGRNGVFRQDKSIAPFETYENDPSEVRSEEIVTIVRMPAK